MFQCKKHFVGECSFSHDQHPPEERIQRTAKVKNQNCVSYKKYLLIFTSSADRREAPDYDDSVNTFTQKKSEKKHPYQFQTSKLLCCMDEL